MAISLRNRIRIAGLLFTLAWQPTPNKTLNAILFDKVAAGFPGGQLFVILTLLSEGLLLVVAAQAGFIGGPRVLAIWPFDSWFPHRFTALSDR